MVTTPLEGREIIFQYYQVGNYVRVTAMDVQTLTEVTITCPRGLREDVMQTNAMRRLEYVLKKKGLVK